MRFLFLLFTFCSFSLAAQTEFYVSPAGNDSSAGTLLQPWKTIQHALNNASPSCTVYLMGGTYSENVVLPVSGTAGNLITLTNYSNQHALISGSALSGGPLFLIHDKNYFVLKGIELAYYTRSDAQGILIDGSCNGIQILSNNIHDIYFSPNAGDVPNANTNAQPLIVNGNNAGSSISSLLIRGNEIHNCRSGYSEALTVNGNVDGFVIADNLVHDNSNSGIEVNGHTGACADANNDQARNGVIKWNKTWNNVSAYAASAGIDADGVRDCVLENNTSSGNGRGIEIACEHAGFTASNITVRNNLVYKNYEGGIVIGGNNYPSASGKLINSSVQGNTISENNISAQSSGELVINYSENISVRSNIICSSGNSLLVNNTTSSPQLHFNFNLYYSSASPEWSWNGNTISSFSSWTFYSGNESASIFADPFFMNGVQNNFHLQSNSPAIDAGDSSYLPVPGESDIDTMSRLQNQRIDIGCDEFGTTVGITENTKANTMRLAYDAVSGGLDVYFPAAAEKNVVVKMISAEGKLVEKTELKKGSTSLHFNTASLAKGTYLIYTESEEPASTKFTRY